MVPPTGGVRPEDQAAKARARARRGELRSSHENERRWRFFHERVEQTASAEIKVSGVLAGIRLDRAFVTFGPAAAGGGLPNRVEALMDAAVGVIVM